MGSSTHEFDVCVIGSGPAGGILAKELAEGYGPFPYPVLQPSCSEKAWICGWLAVSDELFRIYVSLPGSLLKGIWKQFQGANPIPAAGFLSHQLDL